MNTVPDDTGELAGASMRIAFGPVPSRRLGRSLGVNNIPHKACTYSCVYCQVGRTLRYQIEHSRFYEPEEIVRRVTEKVAESEDPIDYLTFVPDGEPTLDAQIGETIERLKPLGIKIAVITNATLIDREEVRAALRTADWVSLKVDSVNEKTWKKVNRPHRRLSLEGILEGMLEFRSRYPGTLATETMLIAGINDSENNLRGIASFLARLRPQVSYISIPTRPPAESWVLAPAERTVARAHQILARQVERVEYLIGYEGNAFAASGDPEEDLLSITAVHPMQEEAVAQLLGRTGAEWTVVEELCRRGQLVETEYAGKKFFLRAFSKKKESA
jgi:wyosine [tRNA(Phe)-imidazoG37] synthetase (radical SAM superfamily)